MCFLADPSLKKKIESLWEGNVLICEINLFPMPDVVAHACNPSSQEAEAERWWVQTSGNKQQDLVSGKQGLQYSFMVECQLSLHTAYALSTALNNKMYL